MVTRKTLPAPVPDSGHPGDSSRRSRKRNQTADHIVAVAFDLFGRHGYAQVTMEQIAAAADVAKGTLYNHFPVKEALVRHRMHADLAQNLPALLAALPAGAGCAARLRAFLRAAARYSEQAREYLPHYLHYRMSRPHPQMPGEHRSGLDQVFTRLLAEGQAAGEIEPKHAPEFLSQMLQFMHLATLLRWLESPGLDLASAFEEMLDLFLEGCASGAKK